MSGDTLPDARRDQGAGSVLVLALCAVVVVGCLAAGSLTQAVAARHGASTAADLGALAAADLVATGDPSACGVAGTVVRANAGRMTSCEVRVDGSVLVGVERPVPGVLAALGPARASARAGPPGQTSVGIQRLPVAGGAKVYLVVRGAEGLPRRQGGPGDVRAS